MESNNNIEQEIEALARKNVIRIDDPDKVESFLNVALNMKI